MYRAKEFRFMAGLPRSGATVLGALLEQDPQVYVSPISHLWSQLRGIDQVARNTEDWSSGVHRDQHMNLLRYAIDAYYADLPQQVVVDKSATWGVPYYRGLAEFVLGERPRIITTVRPLPEIVASFIRKAQENPEHNFIDRSMQAEDFLPMYRLSRDDARVEWLLRPGGQIDSAMVSVRAALDPFTAEMFHVVTYADLIAEPHKTLDGITDFLGVDRRPHTITAIESTHAWNDADAFGIPDLHAVRPTLAATAPPPEDVLSDYALTRCAIEDFWTGQL